MTSSRKYARQSNGGYRNRDKREKRPFPWIRVLIWFFLTVFVFSLGFYTGRSYQPVMLDRDALYKSLASLRDKARDEEEDIFNAAVNEEIEDAEFEFYEDLKETTELTDLPEEAPADGNLDLIERLKTGAKDAVEHEAADTISTVENNGQKGVTGPEVAVTTPSNQKKNALEKLERRVTENPKGKIYTIQVASSKDKTAAETTVGRLIKEGWPAYIMSAEVGDKGMWHRVRIGKYTDKNKAAEVLGRLAQSNLKGYLIVLDPQTESTE